ncbi:MAG TPA: DUF2934 domain-containing protein [Verrucomicrobiae bacterium]|nr:DUF2934 domain-containing protein [Verrucomicrobiae bacterium]
MNKKMETIDESSVSRLAYQLWENAGRPTGRDLEFWLAAESKLRRPKSEAPAVVVATSDKPSKGLRLARAGVKKTWPKPYPSLPKF